MSSKAIANFGEDFKADSVLRRLTDIKAKEILKVYKKLSLIGKKALSTMKVLIWKVYETDYEKVDTKKKG